MPNNPFSRFFSSLFGKISWMSPPWLAYLSRKRQAHPGVFWGMILSILFLGVASGYSYLWYQSRPQPKLVVGQITLPKATKNTKEYIPDVLGIDFGIDDGGFQKQSAAPLGLIGKEIKNGITVTPALPGTWVWDTDSHLTFTPEKDWPAGQEYTIHFAKTVFANPKKLATFDYHFTTRPFQIDIKEWKFYQDPIDAQLHQAVGTIHFNYPVDTSSLENKISVIEQALKNDKMAVDAKKFKFTISYDEHKRIAYVHTESLSIGQIERYIDLIIDKYVKPQAGPSESTENVMKSVLVPDAGSFFKVVEASASIVRNENDRPEQVLTLQTSAGVKDNDLNKALHVYVLPQNYPATAAEEEKKDYAWQNPGEVTPAILAMLKPLEMQAIPGERDYATLHSYKINAPSTRYLYLKLDKGVSSFGNYELNNDYVAVIKAPDYPQEIGFLHKGALLALSGEKKLSVIVRGLPGVKFSIARVLPIDVNQLVTQTDGDFNDPKFINNSFNQQNISQIFSEKQQFDNSDLAKPQYRALDLAKYLDAKANTGGPQGLFLLHAEGWDPEKDEGIDVNADRLILITDLGLVVKDNADGSHDVFVESITNGKPVANANVSVLGKNGLPILTQKTDVSGKASFPTMKDFIEDKEPTVYLAQLVNDVSFIPFNNANRHLNYSRYDIGGVYTNRDDDGETPQTLSAYVFSDRGIYRPGDTAHIAMIVKQAYLKPQPAGLPLEVSIVDPRGMTVKDNKFTLDASGYLALDFATDANMPTGQYTVNLFIVKDNHPSNLLGSTVLQVSEFLPDTMRITAHLSSESATGWVSPEALTANVNLWNLYGAPAADRKVSARILLTPQAVQFKDYPNYIFFDPLLDPKKPPKVFTDTLAETQTNDQGVANFDLKLDRFAKATYQLTFFAEGFAADAGRSVMTQKSMLVSPLTYLIGYKADGDLNYLKQNAVRQIHFIAINPALKQEAHKDLKLALIALHPVSTLIKKPDGTYQYQSIVQSSVLSTTPFAVGDAGQDYTLPTDKVGDYAIAVLDKNNVEMTRLTFAVVGASQQPLPKNAELSVKLNKTEFAPDEDIEMQITAPYTGSGLITIERDKVYASQWFQTNTTSSVQKIHVPKDFQGNGYVNVTFVRDWNSPDIFISPLSYSITPFVVSHAEHVLQVDLDVPVLAKPGEPLNITYKSDKPGKIIVFAVDEGILQVANYKTPDPLAFFFQKRALEVITQQTLDQILPKFMLDREMSSVGGDTGSGQLLKTLNPFKRKTDLPVVYWSGIVDTDATPRQLSYQVPDYFNGAIRVMAVAVTDGAIGTASKMTEVRGNFVITPNVPTFAAPHDEFEMTASIANNVQGSGENLAVVVTLTASPQLEIVGDTKQFINISEGKEQTVHFKLKAKSLLGNATVTLAVSANGKESKMTSTLSVRPVNPYLSDVVSGYSQSDSQVLNLNRDLYPEFRTVEASISTNPLMLVVGLDRYLEDYPYGCTEQLTSKALPLLALANQSWSGKNPQAITNRIMQTVQMLSQRQMSSGGFSYWPGVDANESNKFASVYAMNFLTEAKGMGYNIPSDMLSNGLNYLKDLASETPSNVDEARVQAYAIYILTRNEMVTTNYLTNLQLYLDKDPKHAWHNDITSAYIASTYQLMKSFSDANRYIDYYRWDQPKIITSDFYDQDTENAQYLYLLARHFPDRLQRLDNKLVMSLVNALNDRSMSTVLSGYSSLAFSAYAQFYPTSGDEILSISATTKEGKNTILTNPSHLQKINLDDLVKKLTFTGASHPGFFYQLTQAGFDKTLPDKMLKKGLEVTREYRDPQGTVTTSASLGEEIEVHIKIRALDDRYQSNIAIVDLLPGGFEVVRDSIKPEGVDFTDAREDRIVTFVNLGNEVKEIVYRIKAVNAGKYTVPAITASSMYNPEIVARDLNGSITVN